MTPIDFWSHVDSSGGPTACWPWTGGTNGDGYGVAVVSGVRVYAHRFACESMHGPLVRGEVARHMCAERSAKPLGPMLERACCNPAHLTPGTERENAADRIRHGRGKGQRPRPNADRRFW